MRCPFVNQKHHLGLSIRTAVLCSMLPFMRLFRSLCFTHPRFSPLAPTFRDWLKPLILLTAVHRPHRDNDLTKHFLDLRARSHEQWTAAIAAELALSVDVVSKGREGLIKVVCRGREDGESRILERGIVRERRSREAAAVETVA